MASSRTGSTPAQATSAWMSFLAPIGVTMLVIVPVSAALLSSGVEPVDRDEADAPPDFGQVELVEPDPPPSESGDFAEEVSDVLPASANRRRGFSPVLRGDEEQDPSSFTDEVDDDDDDDDDDEYDDDEQQEQRPRLRPERRAAIVQNMIDSSRKVPFLAGLSGALGRSRARREANLSDLSEEGSLSADEVVQKDGLGGAAIQ